MGPRPCSLFREVHFFSKFDYIKQNIKGGQSIPENLKFLVSRFLKLMHDLCDIYVPKC